jgi:hypothetical protein
MESLALRTCSRIASRNGPFQALHRYDHGVVGKALRAKGIRMPMSLGLETEE